MTTQALVNPSRHMGPYKGLLTAVDRQQLSPAYAVRARNVLLSEGRIRPRQPWRDARGFEHFERVAGFDIYALHHYQPRAFAPGLENPRLILFWTEQGLFVMRDGIPAEPVQLIPRVDQPQYTVQFLEIAEWVFIFTGDGLCYKTQGTTETTFTLGLPRPNVRHVVLAETQPGPNAESGPFSHVVTWSSEDKSVESNYNELPGFSYVGVSHPKISVFIDDETVAPLSQARWLRLYRRNIPRAQIGWRLIGEARMNSGVGWAEFLLPNTESDITLSDEVEGPFAPVRNDRPADITCAAMFDNRLWVNDTKHPDLLRFSTRGEVEHFAGGADFLPIVGHESEHVGGIKDFGGALYVGKSRGIWQVTGQVETPTNLLIATGAEPLDSSVRFVPTRATCGPSSRFGNGFIVAGKPGRLYFGNLSGFYRFDGIEAFSQTDGLEPTWQRFAQGFTDASALGFSYGDDQTSGVLYVAMSARAADAASRERRLGLMFHYKMQGGGWSTCDGDGLGSFADGPDLRPVAFASALPAVNVRAGYSDSTPFERPVLVGTDTGHIAFVDHNPDPTAIVAEWEYETGDIHLADGLRSHVYALKLFLGGFMEPDDLSDRRREAKPLQPGYNDPFQKPSQSALSRETAARVIPLGSDINKPMLRVSVLSDPKQSEDGPGRTTVIDLTTAKTRRIRVGGSRTQIVLRFRGLPHRGYQRHLGIVGWEADQEIHGQR